MTPELTKILEHAAGRALILDGGADAIDLTAVLRHDGTEHVVTIERVVDIHFIARARMLSFHPAGSRYVLSLVVPTHELRVDIPVELVDADPDAGEITLRPLAAPVALNRRVVRNSLLHEALGTAA
jgi:hypothetical protein